MNFYELLSVFAVLAVCIGLPFIRASREDKKERVIASRRKLSFIPILNGGFDSDSISEKDIRRQRVEY